MSKSRESVEVAMSTMEPRRGRYRSMSENATNVARQRALRELVAEVYDHVLRQDFYGTVNLRFTVQDGIIQGIQYSLEQSVR